MDHIRVWNHAPTKLAPFSQKTNRQRQADPFFAVMLK
jgi:hypothetical protein